MSAFDAGAHRETGLHAVLELPWLYRWLQSAVGARRARATFVAEEVRPLGGQRILDVGCGTADLLEHLPAGIHYVGYDLNPRYVERARARHGSRGRFLVGRAGRLADTDLGGPYDRVLMVALLHHLTDEEASLLLAQAARLLDPDGLVVTLDPVAVAGQGVAERFLMRRDRGARIRTAPDYLALLRRALPAVAGTVRDDLLRIPYHHFVARAGRSSAAVSR